MFDFISPVLEAVHSQSFSKSGETSRVVEFYYHNAEKLKKLSGYQNGKHFLPKYYSKSLEDFVRNISLNDIEPAMREISDKLRGTLNLGVHDFHYDVSSSDGGLFETPGLSFDMQCRPDSNNINEVIFTSRLTITLPQFTRFEQSRDVFNAFSFSFVYASVNLTSGIDLKNFIGQLEDHNKKSSSGHEYDIEYYYDPAIQFLEIKTKSSGKRILMYCDHFEIYFSDDYTVFDFLKNFLL